MSYHAFKDEKGESFGSFEVFYVDLDEVQGDQTEGWYWHACFPGCLPDGEPFGPFKTEADAVADALDEEYPLALMD